MEHRSGLGSLADRALGVTQYVPRTNQSTHQGLPLATQSGPNSLSVANTAYATSRSTSLSAGLEWVRQGTDSGSKITYIRADG